MTAGTWRRLDPDRLAPVQWQLVHELWYRGDLRFLLHPGQRRIWDGIHADTANDVFTICVSRQFGKSHMAVVKAIQTCLAKPYQSVRYGAPTLEMVTKIVEPKVAEVLRFAPPDYYVHKAGDVWTFPNGSQLVVVGTNVNGGNRLRGITSSLVVLDECRDMPHLRGLIEDIVEPQFTTTDGHLWLLSTPPDSPAHDFTSVYIERSVAAGTFYHATYRENPLMSQRRLAKLIEKEGLAENSDGFKREYLADYTIASGDRRVFKEYVDDPRGTWFETWQPPPKMACYVCMDLGSKDFTAVIFAVYDWSTGKLVVLDERLLNAPTTDDIAKAIKEGERIFDRYVPPDVRETRYFSDIDLRLFADLKRDHDLVVLPVKKTDQHASINWTNISFAKQKVEIDPRCRNLRFQLMTGVWNERRTDYERSQKAGHLDAADALRYLIQLVRWDEHFIPEFQMRPGQMRVRPDDPPAAQQPVLGNSIFDVLDAAADDDF